MAYTSRELINSAFYLSGVRSRGLQSVSGSEAEDGLERLNDFLNLMWSKTKLIPYYSVVEDNFVIGQEKYFIPNLVSIDTFSFFLTSPGSTTQQSVRIPIIEQTRQEYFAQPRPENVQTIPYAYHLERVYGGSDIYVYFLPNVDYRYQFTGKYAFTNTDYNQDLSLIFDDGYILFLRYGLAIYLCSWYNVVPPAHVVKEYNEIENSLTTLSPMDMTLEFPRYFNKWGSYPNWGDVNLGSGWRP